MKTLNTFSKRILIIAVSLVLLSLSAFLLTVQRVTAEPKQATNLVMPGRVGIGVDPNQHKGYVGLVGSDGSISVIAVAAP